MLLSAVSCIDLHCPCEPGNTDTVFVDTLDHRAELENLEAVRKEIIRLYVSDSLKIDSMLRAAYNKEILIQSELNKLDSLKQIYFLQCDSFVTIQTQHYKYIDSIKQSRVIMLDNLITTNCDSIEYFINKYFDYEF